MKKLFRFLIIAQVLFLPQYLQAQKDSTTDEIETLASSAHKFSGYGGPMLSFSQIDDEFVYYRGSEGALLIDKKFVLGGYSVQLGTDIRPKNLISGNNYITQISHGGVLLGYILNPLSVLHINTSLKAGYGVASVEQEFNDYKNVIDEATLLVLMPAIDVQVNATKWMRFSVGVNYQQYFGANQMEYYDNQKFSRPGVQLRMVFGWFK